MPEIIGPDGNTYYTEDHFEPKKKRPQLNIDGIADYVYLIGGGVAIIRGLRLLADIAIGLILLFLGSTGINYWMMKNKK